MAAAVGGCDRRGWSSDRTETDEFQRSLRALVDMHDLPESLRADAERLDADITAGTLKPRHVPMHGDLWRNNIMVRPGGGELVVIDWAGGTAAGYAIYDLIRFHQSFNLSSDRLRRELLWYQEALGGGALGLAMIRVHLLGALGHYANRLGEFPRDRFVALARDCYGAVDSALAGWRAADWRSRLRSSGCVSAQSRRVDRLRCRCIRPSSAWGKAKILMVSGSVNLLHPNSYEPMTKPLNR